MRKELFDELVESVKEMKAIQAGRLKSSCVTHLRDLLNAPNSFLMEGNCGLRYCTSTCFNYSNMIP